MTAPTTDAPSAGAIDFRNVRLAVGGRIVLDDVSLEIGGAEFIGVLGPNGCGKTTMMRAVLGLVPPREGAIRVLGREAGRANAEIGYLPQVHRADADLPLSGRDFVASTVNGHRLGLPLAGRAGRAAVAHALELVGAQELARRPLAAMSGGERQRLRLAQAVLGRPRLLLLDEPLLSLDPHRQAEVVALVKSLQLELGITVLFSAHELNPLLGALDRVLYLGGGRAALGTVDEVITGPVLSGLYGADIEVVRLRGRIFVMSGGFDVEREAHRHDGRGRGHGPGHEAGHAPAASPRTRGRPGRRSRNAVL